MSDEYDDDYDFDDEPRLSIVDELTPHSVDDEPMRPADPPALRIVDELPPIEADDERGPADGTLVIVSDEQLLSALREPVITDEDEPELAAEDDANEEGPSEEGPSEEGPKEEGLVAEDAPADENGPPSPPNGPDAERPARPRRPQWERPTRIGVAALALIAILFLFVFPTRSYLGQQRQVRNDRRSVAILQAQNKDMAREVTELQTKSEIERMARVQLNMVLPGEQPYSVITPHKSK